MGSFLLLQERNELPQTGFIFDEFKPQPELMLVNNYGMRRRKGIERNQMSIDQLSFVIAITALAISLPLFLHFQKNPFRGFYYYAVEPFFTNAPGSGMTAFVSFPVNTSLFWKRALCSRVCLPGESASGPSHRKRFRSSRFQRKTGLPFSR